jgi:hypothetical protein
MQKHTASRTMPKTHVSFIEHLDESPRELNPGCTLGIERRDTAASWDNPLLFHPQIPLPLPTVHQILYLLHLPLQRSLNKPPPLLYPSTISSDLLCLLYHPRYCKVSVTAHLEITRSRLLGLSPSSRHHTNHPTSPSTPATTRKLSHISRLASLARPLPACAPFLQD